jgi:hypothetical protein
MLWGHVPTHWCPPAWFHLFFPTRNRGMWTGKKYMNWLPWDGSLPGESLERCTWAWALIWHHEDLPLTLLRHHKDRWPPPWSFATRITFINSAITPQQARSASAWQHKETTSTLFISLSHAHVGHDVSTIQKIAVPQTLPEPRMHDWHRPHPWNRGLHYPQTYLLSPRCRTQSSEFTTKALTFGLYLFFRTCSALVWQIQPRWSGWNSAPLNAADRNMWNAKPTWLFF